MKTKIISMVMLLAASWGGTVQAVTCGNNSQSGSAPPCSPGTPPPCPPPSSCAGQSVATYTGNERRGARDLEVWGSVGEEPLAWTRYYNSRFVRSNNIFGNNQVWRHGYEWEISVGFDANGPLTINVSLSRWGLQSVYPRGHER
jgi:hypothetical protein